MEEVGYNMEHVRHILKPIPLVEGSDYFFFEPEELKDFGMLWVPR